MMTGSDRVERLDRHVVAHLRRQPRRRRSAPVGTTAPDDQPPDEGADDQRGDPRALPQRRRAVRLAGDGLREPAAPPRLALVGRAAGGEQQHGDQHQRRPGAAEQGVDGRDPRGARGAGRAQRAFPRSSGAAGGAATWRHRRTRSCTLRHRLGSNRLLPVHDALTLQGTTSPRASPADVVRSRGVPRRGLGRAPAPGARRGLLGGACDDGWADPARLHTGRRGGPGCSSTRPARASAARRSAPGPTRCRSPARGTQACHLGVLGALAAHGATSGRPGGRWRRRALGGAAGRRASTSARRAQVETGVAVDRPPRVDAAAFAAAGRGPGHRAWPALQTGQPRGRHAPARRGGGGALRSRPAYRCTSTRPSRSAARPCRRLERADGERPQVGWPPRRRRARGAPRHPVALPAARRTSARAAGCPGRRPYRPSSAAAVALEAVLADAHAGVAAAAARWSTGSAPRCPPRARRARSSATPTDRLPHLVTFSCLYVDGEALRHRAGPARASPSAPARPARPARCAQPRPGGDGRADPRQRPGVAAAGDHIGRQSSAFLDVLPRRGRRLRARPGRRRCDRRRAGRPAEPT